MATRKGRKSGSSGSKHNAPRSPRAYAAGATPKESSQSSAASGSVAAAYASPSTTVVGIGASAGGVRALKEFFDLLPADPGAAFVVIVHLDPQSRSELP